MTKDQYRSLLAKLKLSQEAFGRAFGIGKRTSQGYANGLPIPVPTAALLHFIDEGKIAFDEVKLLVPGLIKEAAKARKKRESQKANR
jgi:hypothetical protein